MKSPGVIDKVKNAVKVGARFLFVPLIIATSGQLKAQLNTLDPNAQAIVNHKFNATTGQNFLEIMSTGAAFETNSNSAEAYVGLQSGATTGNVFGTNTYFSPTKIDIPLTAVMNSMSPGQTQRAILHVTRSGNSIDMFFNITKDGTGNIIIGKMYDINGNITNLDLLSNLPTVTVTVDHADCVDGVGSATFALGNIASGDVPFNPDNYSTGDTGIFMHGGQAYLGTYDSTAKERTINDLPAGTYNFQFVNASGYNIVQAQPTTVLFNNVLDTVPAPVVDQANIDSTNVTYTNTTTFPIDITFPYTANAKFIDPQGVPQSPNSTGGVVTLPAGYTFSTNVPKMPNDQLLSFLAQNGTCDEQYVISIDKIAPLPAPSVQDISSTLPNNADSASFEITNTSPREVQYFVADSNESIFDSFTLQPGETYTLTIARQTGTGNDIYKLTSQTFANGNALTTAPQTMTVAKKGSVGIEGGEEPLDKPLSMSVYPNPVEDILKIQDVPFADIDGIGIYDAEGNQKWSVNSDGDPYFISTLMDGIDVSDYSNGLYVIAMRDKLGKIYTTKFTKK